MALFIGIAIGALGYKTYSYVTTPTKKNSSKNSSKNSKKSKDSYMERYISKLSIIYKIPYEIILKKITSIKEQLPHISYYNICTNLVTNKFNVESTVYKLQNNNNNNTMDISVDDFYLLCNEQ